MNAPGWEWWAEHGAQHVTPRDERNPEGFDVGEQVRSLLDERGAGGSLVELGCGDGRLAGAFAAAAYVGLDVNEANLAAARKAHPSHTFRRYLPWSELPDSRAVVAWNVLLHTPDTDLPALAALTTGRHVVIGECMTREWRRDGLPPVFNRDPDEYLAAFPRHALAHEFETKIERHAHHGPPRDTLTVLVLEPAC